ncbi:MAG: caspase family protein [Ignavibacteriae bacterium]|nr:caspase family protein [Ignavibacteriota bacterium]
MKKKILLIGNNNGLPGVQKDFLNYQSFFMSEIGGNWYENEIISKMNPKKSDLQDEIKNLKNSYLDFIIVIFSGHAGQERETILEINEKNETIYESELKNISTRQITIYDCCRAYSLTEFSESYDRVLYKSAHISSEIRQLYEKRIMEAIQQQISLYACSVGETANDTSEGGVYSKNLLKAARSIDTDFMSVGKAHEVAKILTKKEQPNQTPDAILPRCLSSQELILSINPSLRKSKYF